VRQHAGSHIGQAMEDAKGQSGRNQQVCPQVSIALLLLFTEAETLAYLLTYEYSGHMCYFYMMRF